ncbi:hypothetical protein [Nonlabens sp.]|uniref:hypothetical protein n=1 Tax=Nonlabens sp. TaxID=1888209 RepID=UPI003F69585A
MSIAIISISSCEKDEVFQEEPAAVAHHKMKASVSSLAKIKTTDSKLYNYLSERALTSLKSGNTGSGAILDTSYIQVLEGTDYKNYIFRVATDSTNAVDVLKNYMLVVLKDSIQQQFMVTYPYVNQVVDTTNVLIEPVFGTDILNQFTLKCGGSSFQSVWIPGSTVSYPCASGRHVFSQGTACDYWEKPGEARVVYTAGYFMTQYVEQQPCETIGTGDTGNGGGGANVNNPNPPPPDDPDDEDENEQDMEIGITPNEEVIKEEDPECDYLKDLLADTDFKRRLTRMISSATDDNIELIHEYTQSLNDSTLIFNADHGDDVNPTAPVRKLPSTILRPIIVHSHYKGTPDRGTIGMFSYGDILTFTLDVFKVNLRGKDTKSMTSILVSSSDDGINIYAIKKDPNSTIANDYNLHQTVRLQMTQEQKDKEEDAYQKSIKFAKSKEVLELAALKQLKKMGLQLYKSTDSHNNWEQLTLDSNPTNSAKPQKGTSIPCN